MYYRGGSTDGGGGGGGESTKEDQVRSTGAHEKANTVSNPHHNTTASQPKHRPPAPTMGTSAPSWRHRNAHARARLTARPSAVRVCPHPTRARPPSSRHARGVAHGHWAHRQATAAAEGHGREQAPHHSKHAPGDKLPAPYGPAAVARRCTAPVMQNSTPVAWALPPPPSPSTRPTGGPSLGLCSPPPAPFVPNGGTVQPKRTDCHDMMAVERARKKPAVGRSAGQGRVG